MVSKAFKGFSICSSTSDAITESKVLEKFDHLLESNKSALKNSISGCHFLALFKYTSE